MPVYTGLSGFLFADFMFVGLDSGGVLGVGSFIEYKGFLELFEAVIQEHVAVIPFYKKRVLVNFMNESGKERRILLNSHQTVFTGLKHHLVTHILVKALTKILLFNLKTISDGKVVLKRNAAFLLKV